MTDEEKRLARNARQRAYAASEKGKATSKRWLEGKGREHISKRDKAKRRGPEGEKGRAYLREWRKRPRALRAIHKKELRRYGLTPKEFADMLIEQCGRCEICLNPMKAGRRGVHVDHDHKTNQVRGLLCGRCNLMLGSAEDNSDLLFRAVGYLESRKTS